MKVRYLFFLSFITLFSCTKKKEKKESPIQNVVVILADDHALKVTGTYGNKIIHTLNIDKLSEEGVLFTHAYCNSPICSASRQSLLTGKYPHTTGVTLLFTPFPDAVNCPEYLTPEGKLVWFCEPRDVGTDQSLTDKPIRIF